MERYLSGQLLLQERETLKDRRVVTGDVNEEVMFVERLELDLDVCRLHDLVDFAVLFPAYELPVLICEFNLEADLVMEAL